MSRAWAAGSTRRWRTIRADVLTRDEHTCQLRIPGTWTTNQGPRRCLGKATQVHHLHGRGRCPQCAADHPDHLVASCQPCNLHIEVLRRAKAKANRRPKPRPLTQW